MRTLALNLALAVGVARAGLDLDAEDIPAPCAVICKPVRELTAICDVDGNRVPDDHTEQLLEAQCICTNDSFDVSKITALCASCIKGNAGADNADDGLEDVSSIMSTCGFSSVSYESASATLGETVTVSALRPTASDQLTTTITGGTSAPAATGTNQNGDGQTETSSPNAAPTMAPGVVYIAGLLGAGVAAVF